MLYPNFHFKNVTSIPQDFFVNNKIRTVLIDLDDTLVPNGVRAPTKEIIEWIAQRKTDGIKLIIFSNNERKRVKEFAIRVNLPFYAKVKKPSQILSYSRKRDEGVVL